MQEQVYYPNNNSAPSTPQEELPSDSLPALTIPNSPSYNQNFPVSSPVKDSRVTPMNSPMDPTMDKKDLEQNAQPKKKNKLYSYLCCCIPKSRNGRIIFAVCLVIILATIGTFLGLFWPRMPDFRVVSLMTLPSTFKLSQIGENDLTATMNLTLTVEVDNQNRYGLSLNQLDLVARTTPNSTNPNIKATIRTVAAGKTYNLYFPAGKKTRFQMNVFLGYDTRQLPPGVEPQDDPLFTTLQSVCEPTGVASNLTLLITYATTVYINGLSNIGVKPVLTNDANVKCPFTSQAQYQQIVSQIQGSAGSRN